MRGKRAQAARSTKGIVAVHTRAETLSPLLARLGLDGSAAGAGVLWPFGRPGR